MNSFVESAYGRRICLQEFGFVLKLKTIKKKFSGEMQRLQMNPP